MQSDADIPRSKSINSRPFRIVVLLFLVVFTLKIFVFDFYRVSSGSMSPALLVGDFLVVWEIPFPPLARNDVVAFTLPPDAAARNSYETGSVFVKRVAALPGDVITVQGDSLLVNGIAVGIVPESAGFLTENHRIIVPSAGTLLDVSPETEALWRPLAEREGRSIVVQNRIVFIDGSPAVEYRLTQNCIFVTGDNPADSYDSRYWGLLPENAVTGKAVVVYWSSSEESGVRLERIGGVK